MNLEDFKPGMWIRCKYDRSVGRAFVLFVKDGIVSYHLEKPYCSHPRLGDGWHTGGTIYAAGFDGWEPDDSRPEPE